MFKNLPGGGGERDNKNKSYKIIITYNIKYKINKINK